MPAAHERYRRRRWLTWIAAAAVLLLLLLLAVDRVAVRVADHVLAQRIKTSQHLGQLPTVRIGGFPFLTQVLAGHYTHVSTDLTGLTRNGLRISALHVRLDGVHLNAGQALHRTLDSIPVDHAVGDIQVSYTDLNSLLRPQGITVGPAGNGGLAVIGTVDVAGLSVAGKAVGTPTVIPAGVRVTVSQISADGVPAALTALLGDSFAFTIPTNGLPYRLSVRSVTVTDTGLDITAGADNLNLPAR